MDEEHLQNNRHFNLVNCHILSDCYILMLLVILLAMSYFTLNRQLLFALTFYIKLTFDDIS